jgi:translation initiation factor 3 subunit E
LKFPDDAEMRNTASSLQATWEDQRNRVIDLIDNEPAVVQRVAAVFGSTDSTDEQHRPAAFSVESLAQQGVTVEDLEAYYRHGKFKYECGMYNDAEQMLGNFIGVAQLQSPSVLGARWGRLACRILGARWDLAMQDLTAIKEVIDTRSVSPVDQIRQRAWFLHWSLFVYINQRDGVDALADLFSEKVYLQTIENLCPWLLRYYVAFVILSPTRRKSMLKEIVQEIGNTSYLYSDPVTQFVDVLFNQFDFEGAQAKLAECLVVMKNDFFLQIFAADFARDARLLICETYCSIHRRVNLATLSNQLQMPLEDAERWLVEMVMNSPSFETRVDCKAQEAIMVPKSRSAHEIVVEKTRDVTARSSVLAGNLVSLLQEQAVLVRARNGEQM